MEVVTIVARRLALILPMNDILNYPFTVHYEHWVTPFSKEIS